MADIKLSNEAQQLLDQVQKVYPGPVLVRFGDERAGFLRHDQAKQEALPDGLVITVTDITAPMYTLTHELVHLLMLLQGFPQIFFQVTFGDAKLDEQMMIMATDLYDVAMHQIVVAEQRKQGLIDADVEALYLKGIEETLTPETDADDERTLRLLTLLDALVFYGDHFEQVEAQLSKLYPLSLTAAKQLYSQLTVKPVDSQFTMRRSIVKLFKDFDEQLKAWQLPALHNTEFTSLSSVFSERQLRLEVRQMFEIFHSDLVDRQTKKPAYIGLQKSDGQNAFVLAPPEKDSAEFFKSLYAKTVQELFDDLKIPYSIRK